MSRRKVGLNTAVGNGGPGEFEHVVLPPIENQGKGN